MLVIVMEVTNDEERRLERKSKKNDKNYKSEKVLRLEI